MGPTTRLVFAALGVAAAATLAVQLHLNIEYRGGLGPALWSMSRFFTLWTTTLVALLSLILAASGRESATGVSAFAAATLFALMVGVAFHVLLSERYNPRGLWAYTNLALHYAIPSATGLVWLLAAPKGRLGYGAPLLWLLFPLTYLVFVLLRGEATGRYPYFFLDIGAYGPRQVALNAAGLCAGFLGAGLAMVALDRALGGRRRAASAGAGA